jgi:hypothetical protein
MAAVVQSMPVVPSKAVPTYVQEQETKYERELQRASDNARDWI